MNSNIILTEDQRQASRKFLNFLMDPNQREFYLFGSAGCGKTFLTRYFIEHSLEQYKQSCALLGLEAKNWSVDLTATTNKAVEVLNALRIKGTTAETVYSVFSVIVRENFKNGSTFLEERSKDPVENRLIFVDECSMLPTKMLSIMRYRGRNSKFVFIGDRYQLAPVKEKPHWAHTPEEFTVELTTPVRNQGQKALVELCNQLRATVRTGVFNDIRIIPGAIEKASDEDAKEWLMNMDKGRKKVLCYTNSRVVQYQDWVQENLRPGLPLLDPDGGPYINNSNYEFEGIKKCVRYYPEEEVVVHDIGPIKEFTSLSGKYKYLAQEASITSATSGRKAVKSAKVISDTYEDYKQILKQAYKNADYQDYFIMKNQVMDLRLPYACTVHKAQGNTYDEVFIDLDSFKSCRDPAVAARLLYVAVSRARNRVVLYGDLPKKYGAIYDGITH